MLSVRGPRAAHEVWADYARPSRWSSWSPQVLAVDAPADALSPGLRGVVHGPLGVRVAFVVTAVDPASRTWRWVVTVAGVRVGMEHAVVSVPGGSVTTLLIEGPAPVRIAYPLAARVALRRLVHGGWA